ncbi:MAG: multidrug efflux system membrane fusion protein [Cryomorphaceae bacterium]|jgi:multidrug efflux system membrane fusion protein
MRRLFNKKIPVITMVILSVFLTACGSGDVEDEVAIRPVRTVLVDGDSSNSQRTFSGVSRSAQESRLSFKVTGTVSAIPVKVGDKIEAGTVIARLDPSSYDLQLQQSQATVAQSSAASRNAATGYQRTRNLYANNNASRGDLDTARANADSASAQLRAARKSLQLAELNRSYTELKVDVDCVVDSISAQINENVSNSSEVARVNCSDEIEIEIAVPESIIGGFKNGKPAEIKFDAVANKILTGKVIEVGVGASGVGSTFPVTVLVDSSETLIRTGLAASVSFVSNSSEYKQYILPLAAVVQGADGTFVYLVQPEVDQFGIIEKRSVDIGELQPGGIEILGGLAKGDRVVTAGISFVRDGLSVSY